MSEQKKNDVLNLDSLMEEARNDLTFDQTNIGTISLSLPRLTEKYARKMMSAKASLKKEEMRLSSVYAELHEYYSKDFNMKVDRKDIEKYIFGDKKYTNQQAITDLSRLQVDYLQSVINAIDKASWNIGNAIKWAIFQAGG